MLVSSHDCRQALTQYDRLLFMNQNLITNRSPKEVMTLENIRRAYGEGLQSKLFNEHLEALYFC